MPSFIGSTPSLNLLPSLTRAGIAHLYSVCIHPYEDGNGRMARALTEKALSQSAGQAVLSGLSKEIASQKKAYYQALEENNQSLDISGWLLYFAQTTLAAAEHQLLAIQAILGKIAIYQNFADKLNERQKKVIDRLYAAEPQGFEGGLSAGNYIVHRQYFEGYSNPRPQGIA